ncbi:MAG: EAL domain-containing protein [Rhodoferax sp.]|nr:EAL domain-containing protein [Rhodoferax sp.]MCF8210583.1 EAL domain-containing protein [Rhodoferax sp.]
MPDWMVTLLGAPGDSVLYQASYSPLLVSASVSIAIFSSYVALLISRPGTQVAAQRPWVGSSAGALSMGVGIWSMHFIGMLALNLPCGVHYDPVLTLVSLVPGIVCSGLALSWVGEQALSAARMGLATLVLGLGIGSLHFIGTTAMHFDGWVRYDPLLLLITLPVTLLLSYVALWARTRLLGQSHYRHALAALVMGAAVTGIHYTAMAAARFVQGNGAAASESLISSNLLVLVIVSTTVLLTLLLAATTSIARNRWITRQLLESEERWEFALDGAGYGVWDWDVQTGSYYFCKRWKAMLGYQEDEFPNTRDAWVAHLHPQEREQVLNELQEYLENGQATYIAEHRMRCKDNRYRWIMSRGKMALRDPNGKPLRMTGTQADTTERKALEESLRQLTVAVEQSPNSILITDLEGRIVYANATFVELTGYPLTEVVGRNPRFLQSGKTPRATFDALWEHLQQGKVWKGELVNHRADGSEFIEAATISPVRDERGRVNSYLAIKEDITAQRQAELRLQHLAHFDQLTGLPNRVLLQDHFHFALSLAERSQEPLAVMFLDLDHFKNINDTLGHTAGDKLLMQVATRLKAAVREIDTVARLGGDEFVFVLPGTDGIGAAHVAQKLMDAVAMPCQIGSHELVATASIGIAMYPGDGTDMDTLSRNADAAMYRVKQESHNNFRFFAQTMQDHLAREVQLASALRHAIARGQLYLHYQPQMSLRDGRVIGAEALLRWTHPELGPVSPAEFIAVAEDTGQIIALGEWVLQTAIAQMKQWLDAGLPEMVIAVNVSAVQFRNAQMPDTIQRILRQTGLPADRLELELTEAAAMHNPAAAVATMNQLHARGVRLAIDDFGTGYSSLSYLKRFAVYKLKIDQSFVRDICSDPEDRAIVTAIIQMARGLGLQTIAEGVETVDQLEFLRAQHCDEVQGYYFSKPLPAAQFEAFVAQSIALRATRDLKDCENFE